MRIAIRWLFLAILTLGALACGSEPDEPCSAADAAAGRCQTTGSEPAALPPGQLLPEWAERLCQEWRRPDGTCDQLKIMADYEECLRTKGVPKMNEVIAQGAGNRPVQRARDRATRLCLELRGWFRNQ